MVLSFELTSKFLPVAKPPPIGPAILLLVWRLLLCSETRTSTMSATVVLAPALIYAVEGSPVKFLVTWVGELKAGGVSPVAPTTVEVVGSIGVS